MVAAGVRPVFLSGILLFPHGGGGVLDMWGAVDRELGGAAFLSSFGPCRLPQFVERNTCEREFL